MQSKLKDSVIYTLDGGTIDLDNYTEKDVDICSIATGLSRVNRFAGQGHAALTVLAHSVILAEVVEETSDAFPVAMYALLHDAPEAYLGDLCSPFKRASCMSTIRAELKLIHDAMLDTICASYSIKPTRDEIELVHIYDKWQALYEAKYIFGDNHITVRAMRDHLEKHGEWPFSDAQIDIIERGLFRPHTVAEFLSEFSRRINIRDVRCCNI